MCTNTYKHDKYIHRGTYIYLEVRQFPKQRTKADDGAKPVNRLYVPKITVFEGT